MFEGLTNENLKRESPVVKIFTPVTFSVRGKSNLIINKTSTLVLILLLLSMSTLYAQYAYADSRNSSYNRGVGELFIGTGYAEQGYAYTLGVSVRPELESSYISSIESVWLQTFKISGIYFSDIKKVGLMSIDAMMGRQFQMGGLSASISGGFGLLGGEKLEIGLSGFTFGVPAELQIYNSPRSENQSQTLVGLNLYSFINGHEPMIGLTLMAKFHVKLHRK